MDKTTLRYVLRSQATFSMLNKTKMDSIGCPGIGSAFFRRRSNVYDGPSEKEKIHLNVFTLPYIGER